MATEILPCVEVAPTGPVKSTVIWMHGLGANGHDFEPIVPSFGMNDDHGVRFVFPHAPKRAVTINMGLIMPAWYDIREIDLGRNHDEEGIRESAAQIESLIAREKERGVPAENMILAGFSQGGAMALHVGLRHSEALAGILALSCYLVCADSVESEISEANRAVSIFQAHGRQDPMIPEDRGAETRDRLIQLGYDVEWKTYNMGHEVHPREIEDIGDWLRRRLRRPLSSS